MGIMKERLKKIPLFKELDDHDLKTILKIARMAQYKNQMPIFLQGTPLHHVYLIVQGKVKIYKKDAHGREQIVWILKEGDIFPLAGFFRNATFPANAKVIEDSTLLSMKIRDFELLLLNEPEILVKLLRVMGERMVDFQTRLEEQILYGRYTQIVKMLLRLCKRHGNTYRDGLCHISTHFSNLELANMVGTSRETISRTISQLTKEQLLYHKSNGALVIDFERLKDKLYVEQV